MNEKIDSSSYSPGMDDVSAYVIYKLVRRIAAKFLDCVNDKTDRDTREEWIAKVAVAAAYDNRRDYDLSLLAECILYKITGRGPVCVGVEFTKLVEEQADIYIRAAADELVSRLYDAIYNN